jgi:hypothetical protein
LVLASITLPYILPIAGAFATLKLGGCATQNKYDAKKKMVYKYFILILF